jgi:hypothetical protein
MGWVLPIVLELDGFYRLFKESHRWDDRPSSPLLLPQPILTRGIGFGNTEP